MARVKWWMHRRMAMLLRIGYFSLGACWFWTVAHAQQVASSKSGVGYDMAQIEPSSWFWVLTAAAIGGLVKLLGDIPTLDMKGWRTSVELVGGMVMSVVAGGAIYLLILSFVPTKYEPSGPLVCVLSFIAGYGGKRTLDELLKRQNKQIAEAEIPTFRGGA